MGIRKTFSMDKQWRFHIGEVETPLPKLHAETYMAAKAGGARGAAAPGYDDSSWRELNLPHDWCVETEFDSDNSLSQGYKTRGIGWYRKTFYLDNELKGKQLLLVFDGVSTACTVYFNGSVLTRNYSGYTEFTADITDRAYFDGKPNVISIRVDANAFEGWWYEGAGIYRHTWLIAKEKVHIAHNGMWIKPVKKENGEWDTMIETTVENSDYENTSFELVHIICDPQGKEVGRVSSKAAVERLGTAVITDTILLKNPKLWDVDEPNLYQLQTVLYQNSVQKDSETTSFGYRTVAVSAEQGFLLNGRQLKIKGTCNHQDHAGVGVAVPDAIQDFRIRRLKEMGTNGYRCAHGNPAKEILDACDRYGILVLDENRNFESGPEVLGQLETMVLRDRNHPCVVMYSLFNEEPLQGTPEGKNMMVHMLQFLKKLDDTRPILGAMNGGVLSAGGAANAMDITGINYDIKIFDEFHKINPNQPVIGSENNSAFSTRGIYKRDDDRHVIDNYDIHKAPWGQTVRETWEMVDKRDFIAGIFIWTGFDYRGEPTPYAWPSISTQFGIMDTCGIAKDSFYFNKACFTKEPMLHLLPHWNFEPGEEIKVMTVTNCEEAELFLNGKSLGRKASDVYTQCEWTVAFEPGVLSAKAYQNEVCVCETKTETTGLPKAVKIVADRLHIKGDGSDTVPVNVCVVDSEGRIVPTASNLIRFKIQGDGSIIGVGNGDPNCHEPDLAAQRSLFSGWCQGLLQSSTDAKTISLTVESDGLESDTVVFEVEQSKNSVSYIFSVKDIAVGGFRMTQRITDERPDPNMFIEDSDMNTLEPVSFGTGPQERFTHGYVLYRTRFTLPSNIKSENTAIALSGVIGNSIEVYVAKELVGQASYPNGGNMDCRLPANLSGELELSVLIQASDKKPASGISKVVKLKTQE